jgi:hypothetical protein
MPSKLQPRLMLDNTNTIYEVSDEAVPKRDEKTGAQKLDRETGLPMWTVALYGRGRAAGKKWSQVINVTVVSADRPDAEEGEQVVPIDLEALPWVSEQNGKARSGTAFKATGLQVVSRAAVKVAA